MSVQIQMPPPNLGGLRAQVDLYPAARWITPWPPPKAMAGGGRVVRVPDSPGPGAS